MNYLQELALHVRQTTHGRLVPGACRRSVLNFQPPGTSKSDYQAGWYYVLEWHDFDDPWHEYPEWSVRFHRDSEALNVRHMWVEWNWDTDCWEVWQLFPDDDGNHTEAYPVCCLGIFGHRFGREAKELARSKGYTI